MEVFARPRTIGCIAVTIIGVQPILGARTKDRLR